MRVAAKARHGAHFKSRNRAQKFSELGAKIGCLEGQNDDCAYTSSGNEQNFAARLLAVWWPCARKALTR